MAASSHLWSGDAGTKRVSQPFGCVAGDAGTERVSQPFDCVARVQLHVGSFNMGLFQNQIEAKGFPKSTLVNFRRIVAYVRLAVTRWAYQLSISPLLI